MSEQTTFSIPRVDWFRVLDDVLPFTGDDDTQPMLTGVNLTLAGKKLTAAGTDRFSLGVREYVIDDSEAEITGEDFTILVSRRDVAAMKRFHVPHQRGLPQKTLNVTVKGRELGKEGKKTALGRPTVESGGFIQIESGGKFDATVTSVHKGLEWEFVKYDNLIPDPAKATGTPCMAWSPEFMARFAKVHNPNRHARVTFYGERKPVRVDIGDQFIGLLMPQDRERYASGAGR